ncbi:galactosyltransferase-like protein [Euroglyphus maynei]|uniref:Hexosyltransferase n=1 Tax=Euroglyphus maynei TaxID=6958 RepID=A0A1Y3AWG0_EURMA|nr:galactosyltransferase-like protein [Euroglyphus maynei]
MYVGGVFIHPFETAFNEENFHYPIYTKDFRYFIENAKQNLADNALKPINNYSFHYHLNPKLKCQQELETNLTSLNYSSSPITLLLVVKSATCNFLLRNVIRQTWGNEQRFSDVQIRTVFMLGECSPVNERCTNTFHHYPSIMFTKKSQQFRSIFALNQTVDCQQLINIENQFYGDLVQADFIDSYYNNTKKTMASLQWTAQNCHQVPFILFVDDDYYISIKNLLKFSHNYLRLIIPTKLQSSMNSNDYDSNSNDDDQYQQQLNQFDGRLYVGYVFPHSHPLRHLTSKWYISLEEYPWDRYPPYVTGGCFLVNNQTLIDLYYASLYSQPFKYDDVYLGILAYRMKINLIDNKQQMHFYPFEYDREKYSTIIGSHGFHDAKFLWQVWNEQKSLGNA